MYAQDAARRRGLTVLLGLLAWLAATLASAGPAGAHAVLLSSEPTPGAELDEAPAEVLLRFSEPVDVPPDAVRVFAADASRVDPGAAAHGDDASQIRVALPAGLDDGVYTVSWRAVSADAHPVRGSFTFTVGDPGEVEAVAVEDIAGEGDDPVWEVVAGLARWATYAGVLLAAGGAAFLVLVHDRREAELAPMVRVLTWGAVAGVAATVVELPAYAALATGLGAGALADAGALASALASGVGVSALLRMAGLTLLLTGLPRVWTRSGTALVAAGGLLALASFLLAGHTAATEPRALVLASNLVHTATAATWFGGLVLLALVLRWRGGAGRTGASGAPGTPGAGTAGAGGGARVVRRFSTLALVTLAALTAAGLALAWAEVRSLEALVTTSYGWTLLAKLALVAVVVAIAAYNRRRLAGSVAAAGDAAWRRLTTTVRFEAAVVVAVLGVTAVLVALVPARTAAGIGEVYVDYLPLGPDHQVNLVIDPARTGRNEIHLYVLDEAGQLADLGEELTVRLSLPEAGIAPLEVEPFVAGPGHWLHVGRELSVPGRWRVEVRVLVDEFERLTAAAEVDIGGPAR